MRPCEAVSFPMRSGASGSRQYCQTYVSRWPGEDGLEHVFGEINGEQERRSAQGEQ